MTTYLFLNVLILAGPILVGMFGARQYFPRLRGYAATFGLVSIPFLLWDYQAVAAGHWSFAPQHVGTLLIAGLPIEEILFFYTVPFSCLFFLEGLVSRVPKDRWHLPQGGIRTMSVICVGLALVTVTRPYTSFVLLVTSMVLVLADRLAPKILYTSWMSLYLLFGVIVFVIFNSILTGLPVVIYGPAFITGIRIGTIPIEDFFFNLSLLTGYAVVYLKYRPIERG